MWRRILWMILFTGALAQCQSAPAADDQRPAGEAVAATAETIGVDAAYDSNSYNLLARGREEKLGVGLCITGEEGQCPFIAGKNEKRLILTSLELQNSEGLTILRHVGGHYLNQNLNEPMMAEPGEKSFQLKIRASSDISIGAHELKGRLIYQTLQDGRLSSPRQLDVKIPVRIVTSKEWPYAHTSTAKKVGTGFLIVAFFPVVVLAMVVLYAGCHGGGC
jgi:hypothetical protein